MDVTVLGPLVVTGADPMSRRDRVVLAALAVRAGRPVGTDQLVDALWGERPPASAHKILQGCIVRLRKVLGPDAIETSPRGYVLAIPPDQLDSRRFERLVVRARELLVLGQADRASYQLTEALALWDGRTIREYDARSGRQTGSRRMEAVVGDVAYSPDGTVVGPVNGVVSLLSADTLEPLPGGSDLRLGPERGASHCIRLSGRWPRAHRGGVA
jgi:hypothetical protein